MNLLFKLSHLNSNFELTLGFLNPALNNSALEDKRPSVKLMSRKENIKEPSLAEKNSRIR